MIVGVMTVQVMIPEAHSLKDKRRVVKSVKQRLRNRFNVSVAEVDHLDAWQRATLGIAQVGNATRDVHSQLDQIVDVFRSVPGLSLLDYERECL